MESDFDLLDAWREGNRKAGSELLNRYFDQLYRFFRSKVGGDEADDLVQVTLLACVEGKDDFRKASSLRTYLFRVARNRLYSHYRTRAKRDQLDFGVTSVHDLNPSAGTLVEEKRRDLLLVEGLKRIPLELQVALELYYYENLSGPELAEALEIPEGTARTRVRRGLEQLREAVRRLVDAGHPLATAIGDLEAWAASLESMLSQAREA